MTTFDKREQAYEAQFVHDEELRFKARARCNRLLGNWAAAQLGLSGGAATSYANGLVTEHLETRTPDDILRKVAADLGPKGISPEEIALKMQECLQVAMQQIAEGI